MKVYKPTYKDKKTGRKKQCRKYIIDSIDNNKIRQSLPAFPNMRVRYCEKQERLWEIQNFLRIPMSSKEEKRIVDSLQVDEITAPDTMYVLAEIYEVLGERDDALEWIERALRAGYPLDVIEDYAAFDALSPLSFKPICLQESSSPLSHIQLSAGIETTQGGGIYVRRSYG